MASKTNRWVTTALFTALTAVATASLSVPVPMGGYVHFGDALVILSAFFLGPWYGAIAAGFGSALADVLLGYMVYAPGTLVIKALMAMTAGLLMKVVGTSVKGRIACGISAEVVMVLGYWFYDALLMGSLLASASCILPNCLQGTFGVIASTVLVMALHKVPRFSKA